jgi:hypothetical protein
LNPNRISNRFVQLTMVNTHDQEVEAFINPALVRFIEPNKARADLCVLHFGPRAETANESIIYIKGAAADTAEKLEAGT